MAGRPSENRYPAAPRKTASTENFNQRIPAPRLRARCGPRDLTRHIRPFELSIKPASAEKLGEAPTPTETPFVDSPRGDVYLTTLYANKGREPLHRPRQRPRATDQRG